MQTVIVGMSGGVDSSVTALLLKKQGYRVIGLFMKNWEEEGPCPAEKDYEDVVSVCQQLDIPHYSVNFSKHYWDKVFSKCLDEYRAGYTPNPDILCNREIKFKVFFEKAMELGADFLATGHYCTKSFHNSEWWLGRGVDPDKDQSYFLYTLKSEILKKVLFPIGDLSKKEVRELAAKHNLSTAQKKDSTGICFIGKRDFKTFLNQYIPSNPGNFERLDGTVVGKHDGIAFYTIGQRKGLGLGGAGDAWYVMGKDVPRNVVIVERGDHHEELYKEELTASDVSWVGSCPTFPLECTAKVRYRTADVPCTVFQHDSGIQVRFHSPQKAITSRQSIVFYQGSLCLGGALIN